MKRLIFLVILVAVAFYGIWPALSVYGIYTGLDTENEDTLARKVDWPSVRASFKEAVEPAVAEELRKQAKNGGGGWQSIVAGQLSETLAPKIVDLLVETYVTPRGLIQLVKTGGEVDMNAALAKLKMPLPPAGATNRIPGLPGGLGKIIEDATNAIPVPGADIVKKAADPNDSSAGAKKKPSFGLANIKSFHFNSFTELEMAVARKPSARKPDLTAAMGFRDMDWKLTKVVPHL